MKFFVRFYLSRSIPLPPPERQGHQPMDEWSETLRALPKATDLCPWCGSLLVIELCFVFQAISIRCETPNRER